MHYLLNRSNLPRYFQTRGPQNVVPGNFENYVQKSEYFGITMSRVLIQLAKSLGNPGKSRFIILAPNGPWMSICSISSRTLGENFVKTLEKLSASRMRRKLPRFLDNFRKIRICNVLAPNRPRVYG